MNVEHPEVVLSDEATNGLLCTVTPQPGVEDKTSNDMVGGWTDVRQRVDDHGRGHWVSPHPSILWTRTVTLADTQLPLPSGPASASGLPSLPGWPRHREASEGTGTESERRLLESGIEARREMQRQGSPPRPWLASSCPRQ